MESSSNCFFFNSRISIQIWENTKRPFSAGSIPPGTFTMIVWLLSRKIPVQNVRLNPSSTPSLVYELQSYFSILVELGKHPHIVEFLDSFSDKRRSFIVMEFCRFGSLKDLIDEQGTLPLRCGWLQVIWTLYSFELFKFNTFSSRLFPLSSISIPISFFTAISNLITF